MTGIFINYRTNDASWAQTLVDNKLTDVFGRDKVFLDQYSLRPGVDFPPELWRRLSTSTILVALIGPQWLTLTDPKTGERLLDQPNDYVRREIEYALEHGIEVWPVLLNEAQIDRTLLPASIRSLADRQYLPLRQRGADYDIARLVDELREKVPAARPRPDTGAAQAGKYHQSVYGNGNSIVQGDNVSVTHTGTTHYYGMSRAVPPDVAGQEY